MAGIWFSRGVYPFGDGSLLILDMNGQYVCYFAALRRALLGDGSLLYSWSRTLGGEMMGTAAYYLASPYNLLLLLFPETHITEAILAITLSKIGSSGISMYLFLRYGREYSSTESGGKESALLFSTAYALCAYQVVQAMNLMWIDSVILAPLLLWAEENLIRKKRWLPLFWVLWAAFVTNYYTGYMLALFSCLYLLFLLVSHPLPGWKAVIDRFLRFAVTGILAALSASFVLLPALYSLRLGKLNFSSPDFSPRPQFTMLELLCSLLPNTYSTVRPEGMPLVYCGILPLLLFPVFLLSDKIPKRRKYAAAALLSILAISLQITTLDLVWHGFQTPNWLPGRYSFLLSLLLLVFSREALPHAKDSGYLPRIFAGMLLMLLIAEPFSFSFLSYGTLAVSALLMLCWTFLLSRSSTRRRTLLMAALLITEMGLSASLTLEKLDEDVFYSSRSSYVEPQQTVSQALAALNSVDDSFYRLESTFSRCVNDPINYGYAGLSHSSSSLNARPIALFKKLGLSADSHWSSGGGATEAVHSLFSVKYLISKDDAVLDYPCILQTGDVSVYQNSDAMPLVFAAQTIQENELPDDNPFAAQTQIFSQLLGEEIKLFHRADVDIVELYNIHEEEGEGHLAYITDDPDLDSFVEYTLISRIDGMLYAAFPTDYPYPANLWVNGEFLSTCFDTDTDCIIPLGYFEAGDLIRLRVSPTHGAVYFTDALFATCDVDALHEAASSLSGTVRTLTVEDTRVEASVVSDDGGILFTTIPYEPGWKAEVDGNPVETHIGFEALLCIPLEAGKHQIVLSFRPDEMIFGPVLSLLGFLMVFLLACLERQMLSPEK